MMKAITENWTKKWRDEHGKLHRSPNDGPAVIWANGLKEYYCSGKLHRTDGPALIWPDGDLDWYIDGEPYSFSEWADKLNHDQETRQAIKEKYDPEPFW